MGSYFVALCFIAHFGNAFWSFSIWAFVRLGLSRRVRLVNFVNLAKALISEGISRTDLETMLVTNPTNLLMS